MASISIVRLQDGFRHLQSFVAVEIRRLLGDHFQAFVPVDDAVKALGAVPRVVVAHQPQQFDVLALFANLFDEVFAEGNGAGIVVRQQLSGRSIGRVDLAVDTEDRNTGVLRPLDVGDRTVRVGGIEQNRRVSRGDDVVEMRGFLGGVVLGIEQRRFISQFDGSITRRLAQYDEPRVVQRRDDDSNFLFPGGSGGSAISATGEQQGR